MSTLLAQLRRSSREHFGAWARDADAGNAFPSRSVEHLRELGLMSAAIPQTLGGLGLDVDDLCEAAQAIGEGCLSTALIWSMHSQQVATLCASEDAALHATLRDIAHSGALVASVTSEQGKGGDLFTARSALRQRDDGQVDVSRIAPIVSYGHQAEHFLITMRASEEAPEDDVRFVLLDRTHGEALAAGEWNAMGVRGTQSIPMKFEARVPAGRVVAGDYRTLALRHFVPIGQMLWAASWYGAVNGLFQRTVELLYRSRKELSAKLGSDLFVSRVANVRIKLVAVESMLHHVVAKYGHSFEANVGDTLDLITLVNVLKVYASETAREVVDEVAVLSGFARSYLVESPLAVERIYRDVLSARLMYSNDVLRRSIGIQVFGGLRRSGDGSETA